MSMSLSVIFAKGFSGLIIERSSFECFGFDYLAAKLSSIAYCLFCNISAREGAAGVLIFLSDI